MARTSNSATSDDDYELEDELNESTRIEDEEEYEEVHGKDAKKRDNSRKVLTPSQSPNELANRSSELSSKEKDEFQTRLLKFMRDRGTPITKVPTLGHKELDLFTLYHEVTTRGGVSKVIAQKLWQEIAKTLNLPSTCTDSGFRLRVHYMKYVYPYERKFFLGLDDGNKAASKRSTIKSKESSLGKGQRKRWTRSYEDSDDDSSNENQAPSAAVVDFSHLSFDALRRYRKFYRLSCSGGSKEEMVQAVSDHFHTIHVEECEVWSSFLESC
mmetsp:Transcript_17391/g.28576  ORF Transcript_17391/g.28576 Transcript_17391/m.28576 type:complete len:270 (+) Transcript_17391:173-982(+)